VETQKSGTCADMCRWDASILRIIIGWDAVCSELSAADLSSASTASNVNRDVASRVDCS
jgi:hypothetical protein